MTRQRVPIVLLVSLLLSAPAWADYKQDFADGVRAFDQGQWSEVVRLMESAIAENPSSGESIRLYGTRFEDYLPYYYLGAAFYELGRYQEAQTALMTSLQQGAISKAKKKYRSDVTKLLAEISQKIPAASSTRDPSQDPRTGGRRSDAARQPAPTGPTPAQLLVQAKADAQRALDAANQARSAASGVVSRAESLGVFDSNPALRRRVDQADAQLERARQQLIGATTAESAESAKATLLLLAGEYGTLRSELDTQVRSAEAANAAAAQRAAEDLATQTQGLLRSLQGDVSEAERLLSRATEDGHPSLTSGRQRLARAITAAKAADGTTSAGALNSLRSELRSSSGSLRTALANVPAPEPETVAPDTEATEVAPPRGLRDAAAAFFRGDNDGALRLLSATEFDDPRATFQAGLLRSAALYRKFLLGRRSDPSLLNEAREAAAKCRDLDPSFEPDPRYFSPDFVSLYRDAVGP